MKNIGRKFVWFVGQKQKDGWNDEFEFMGYMKSMVHHSLDQQTSSNESKSSMSPIVLFLIGMVVITFIIQNLLMIGLSVIFIGFIGYLFTR